jgi:hypothetical protein
VFVLSCCNLFFSLLSYHHAPRNFSDTLREVRKQDCLLFDTHVGPERFPVLKVLISQAPSLESMNGFFFFFFFLFFFSFLLSREYS